jgi:CcmD family protein
MNSSAQEPQMADLFRKEGKIYVVIGVILIIFAGLVAFLVYLDRKLNKLEKK